LRLDLKRVGATDHTSFSELLLRPFIDLEPCARGPLYARALEHYWAAFADARRPRFALQRTLPRTFRAQFLREAGLSNYQVEDPRDLSPPLRSPRWTAVCDALDTWPDLGSDGQCRLVRLLHALCFYSLISNLIPSATEIDVGTDPEQAELAYWRASARYALGRPDRIVDYSNANLSDFEAIARRAPRGSLVALNAALKVFVHKCKFGASVEELVKAHAHAELIVDSVIAKVDDFTRALLLSRFYRAAAFVPQRHGDHREVGRLMDLAEEYALAMAPIGEDQALLHLENLHPLLESRTKEALWRGDLDLALARALRVVDVDALDPKTWLELGQVQFRRNEYAPAAEAYLIAATLGPPASAIARHMAGLCFREIGQTMLAAFFFKAAVDVDPRAISPHDEIQRLPDLPIIVPLKEWSLCSFAL
jgi:tetratricopeptide (TPR) repeat protein